MKIKNYFLTGLLVILPISLTLYISYNIFMYILVLSSTLIPSNYYFGHISFLAKIQPIIGHVLGYLLSLLTTISIVIIIGMLALNYFGRFIITILESMITKIPFASSLYTTIKQISEVILSDDNATYRQVVMIDYPRKGIKSMGFLTNKSIGIGKNKKLDEYLTIFIPTAPNPTSGFLVLAKREEVSFLKMNVEDAIKLVISAGAVKPFDKIEIKDDKNKGKA